MLYLGPNEATELKKSKIFFISLQVTVRVHNLLLSSFYVLWFGRPELLEVDPSE